MVLNKIDLLPYSGVSLDELTRNVREVNPYAPIFPVSCRTGEGLGGWIDWLKRQIDEARADRQHTISATA